MSDVYTQVETGRFSVGEDDPHYAPGTYRVYTRVYTDGTEIRVAVHEDNVKLYKAGDSSLAFAI